MPERDVLDHVLVTLVAAVNAAPDDPARDPTSEGIGVGMTLTVAGSVISGYLIPNWQWFDEMDSRVTVGGGGGLGVVFAEVAQDVRAIRDRAKHAAAAVEQLPERYQGAVYGLDPTTYIHLRDARVYTGRLSVPTNGMHWRGRLIDVSGWCFGKINTDEGEG